jgi:hypothetical protein
LRWTLDEWKTWHDAETNDTKLGIHLIDFPANELAKGNEIIFTFRWTESGNWEGRNFRVALGPFHSR